MSVTNHHWIQVKHLSYPTIRELIRTGHAKLSDRTLKGVWSPETWLLNADVEVSILSDQQLSIAGRMVTAQLSCFSTPMYEALIAKSPSFTQYDGLDGLYRQVRQPPEGWNAAGFARLLEETVRAGRRPDVQPRLVSKSMLYTAQWQADQIYLRRDKCGDWFLAMVFDVQHIPGRQHSNPMPVGLDVGLKPLTVACTGAGEFQMFPLSSLEHLRDVIHCGLTPEAQGLLARMAYASGREDTQQMIGYLNQRASRVYAEDLNLDGMNLGYIQTARATAIHDYHFSDLPQSMYAAGISFKRVPPYYTSQRCAHCYVEAGVEIHGDRQRHRLTCPRCQKVYNAHEVAAQNVLIIGEERYAAAQKRRR